jgi:hypothetical protein
MTEQVYKRGHDNYNLKGRDILNDPEEDGLARHWKTVNSWQEFKKEGLWVGREHLSSMNAYEMEILFLTRRETLYLNKHCTGSITHTNYEHRLLSSSKRVTANDISCASPKKRPIPAVQPRPSCLIAY